MTEEEAVDAALAAFPKLYYFVPSLTPFPVPVPEENREYLSTKTGKPIEECSSIKIEKPIDAILWLIETASAPSRGGYCKQNDISHLVSRWTKLTFSREIAKLYAADLVDGRHQSGGDHRYKELKLTDKGKRILDKIKTSRKQTLHLLFKGLGPKRMVDVATALGQVANATWPVMTGSRPTVKHQKRKTRSKTK